MSEFKKLTEKEVVESVSENGHLFAEDGGKIVRIPAAGVGGGSVPHAVIVFENDVYRVEILDGSEEFIPDAFPIANTVFIDSERGEACKMVTVSTPGDGNVFMSFYSFMDGKMFTLALRDGEVSRYKPVS